MGQGYIPYEPYHPHLGYTIALTLLVWVGVFFYTQRSLQHHPRIRVILYGIAIMFPIYAELASFAIYAIRPAADTPIGYVLAHIHANIINHLPIDTFLTTTIQTLAIAIVAALCLISWARYLYGSFLLSRYLASAQLFTEQDHPALAIELGDTAATQRVRIPQLLLIDSPAPLALTTGIFRPRVYLSRQLLEMLTTDELLAVICHEWAHILRRDNLWNWAMRLLRDLLSFVPTTQIFWRSMIASQDEACDALAVRMTGQPLVLARALVKVAAAWSKQHHPVVELAAASPFALAASDPTARVEQMIWIETEITPANHQAIWAYLLIAIALLLGVLPALLGS
ncbi:MAG: hypothetical protein Fur005_14600 [Roseiflexaceae bacterium]